MGGGKNDSIRSLASEHFNILLFNGDVRLGAAEDDTISQLGGCLLYSLGQFGIKRVGNICYDKTQSLCPLHHQTSGDEIGPIT